MAKERPFAGAFAPSAADLSQCVRCGLCLQHCPTYLETGLETESPRGRLYLIKAMSEGLLAPTVNTLGHMDMCLQCRNCEAVCPSGVKYGRIMEGARAGLLSSGNAPLAWRLRALFLREVVARPRRLGLLAGALRIYQATGARVVAERVPGLRERVMLAPTIRGKPFRERGVIARPARAAKRRVALLTGCIMPLAFGRVHRATARVLAHNGCEVVAPASQVCCGALHAHNGDLATAIELARRNIDAFLAEGCEAIIVNSAGCGAAMREYRELLANDSEYQARAAQFARLVKDINEFLVDLPLERPNVTLERTVTYQDSCHLAHAQRISQAPRQVLSAVSGIQLLEMAHPDRCCGSAGVYAFTQREMSLRLLDAKISDISATGAEVVATANPGCMAQLEAGLRLRRLSVRVVHTVELLDEAYRR